MSRPARLAALLCASLLFACGEGPRSFRQATLAETSSLLADPSVSVVEAIEGSGRGLGSGRSLLWRLDDPLAGGQPELAGGAVLVLGSSIGAAHRSAAAFARAGHTPVWVFVPETDRERAALAAHPLEAREKTRGEGS